MVKEGRVVCFMVCAVLCVLFTCTGCSSTHITDSPVLQHQGELAEYKATVDGYIQRIDKSVGRIESIRTRAEGLGGTVDETIELFDEYQRAVERLLQDYNDLRNEIESRKEDSSDTAIDSFSTDRDKGAGSGS